MSSRPRQPISRNSWRQSATIADTSSIATGLPNASPAARRSATHQARTGSTARRGARRDGDEGHPIPGWVEALLAPARRDFLDERHVRRWLDAVFAAERIAQLEDDQHHGRHHESRQDRHQHRCVDVRAAKRPGEDDCDCRAREGHPPQQNLKSTQAAERANTAFIPDFTEYFYRVFQYLALLASRRLHCAIGIIERVERRNRRHSSAAAAQLRPFDLDHLTRIFLELVTQPNSGGGGKRYSEAIQ